MDPGTPSFSAHPRSNSPLRRTTMPSSPRSALESPGSASSNIKGKLNDVYHRLDTNDTRAEDHGARISTLEHDRDNAGDETSQNLKLINQKVDSEIKRVVEELEHRFLLQLAENKRLQAQLTQSKHDYQALLSKVNTLEDRIRDLEEQIGE